MVTEQAVFSGWFVSKDQIAFAVDALDDNGLFDDAGFLPVLVEDGFQGDVVEFFLYPGGDCFPDGTAFTDVMARAIVGFFAKADDETDTFIEQFDHCAKTDVGKRFVEPDATMGTDYAGGDGFLSQDGKDAFDGFQADIGLL